MWLLYFLIIIKIAPKIQKTQEDRMVANKQWPAHFSAQILARRACTSMPLYAGQRTNKIPAYEPSWYNFDLFVYKFSNKQKRNGNKTASNVGWRAKRRYSGTLLFYNTAAFVNKHKKIRNVRRPMTTLRSFLLGVPASYHNPKICMLGQMGF